MPPLSRKQGVTECSCKISSVETRSRDCKSHREGCEGAEAAKRRKGTPFTVSEEKGKESFQFEMLLLRKDGPSTCLDCFMIFAPTRHECVIVFIMNCSCPISLCFVLSCLAILKWKAFLIKPTVCSILIIDMTIDERN